MDMGSSSSPLTHTKQLYSGIPLLSSPPFSPCVTQLKGFPSLSWRCGDNSQTPCSLGPVCHAVYLWSRLEDEGVQTGAKSEKLKLCDLFSLSSCLSYEIVQNIRAVISVFTQGSLIQYRNKPMTQASLFKFWPHLSVLFFPDYIASASMYKLETCTLFYYIQTRFLKPNVVVLFFFLLCPPAKYFTSRNGEHEPMFRCCRCRTDNGSKELAVYHHPRAGVLH